MSHVSRRYQQKHPRQPRPAPRRPFWRPNRQNRSSHRPPGQPDQGRGEGTTISRNFIHAARDGVVKMTSRKVRTFSGRSVRRTEVTVEYLRRRFASPAKSQTIGFLFYYGARCGAGQLNPHKHLRIPR